MPAPPITPPGGGPQPPATADEALRIFSQDIQSWEKIDPRETRDMLARLLNEQTAQAQGPLQGSWAVAEELLAQARREWSSPTGDAYTPLIAACLTLGRRPVPAAPASPAPTAPASSPASIGVAIGVAGGIIAGIGGAAAAGAFIGVIAVGAATIGAFIGGAVGIAGMAAMRGGAAGAIAVGVATIVGVGAGIAGTVVAGIGVGVAGGVGAIIGAGAAAVGAFIGVRTQRPQR